MKNASRRPILAVLPMLATSVACLDSLAPGEFGTFRHFAVAGPTTALPLALTPPVSDRDGNVYLIYGERRDAEAYAAVGQAAGGWGLGCSLNYEGDDFGIHGWVGHAQNKAWYWAGNSLVGVSGATGGCGKVLNFDPRSNSRLMFRAIMPYVEDAPSLTTLLAFVQTENEPAPSQVRIDLRNKVFLDIEPFEPQAARQVEFLGSGANPDTGAGLVVVRYELSGTTVIEGRAIDSDAKTLWVTPIASEAENLREYAIVGFLRQSESGVVAGLAEPDESTPTRQLVVFGDGWTGDTVVPIDNGMNPYGVHSWDGQLYVVGTVNGDSEPAIATIDEDGSLGAPQSWAASRAAADVLHGPIMVENERTQPRRHERWEEPSTAMGPFPFVSDHQVELYAPNAVGWIVSGPSYEFDEQRMFKLAFAPVGIEYP